MSKHMVQTQKGWTRMGHPYSEVRCLIYGLPDPMVRWFTGQRLIKDSAINQWLKHIKRYTVEHIMVKFDVLELHLDGVKFDRNYPAVDAWCDMMWEIMSHPETTNLRVEFVRMGEEIDDAEMFCSDDAFGWLDISRKIVTDLPKIVKEIDDGCADTDQTAEG